MASEFRPRNSSRPSALGQFPARALSSGFGLFQTSALKWKRLPQGKGSAIGEKTFPQVYPGAVSGGSVKNRQ